MLADSQLGCYQLAPSVTTAGLLPASTKWPCKAGSDRNQLCTVVYTPQETSPVDLASYKTTVYNKETY